MKATVDTHNSDKWTPLHYMVHNQMFDILNRLDFRNCKVLHNVNKNGDTALIMATKKKYERVAIKLINHGAKIDIKDRAEKNALHHAAENSLFELIKVICDINKKQVTSTS